MLTKTEKLFTFIYMLFVGAELLCANIGSLTGFRYITKPAIVLSLLVFFFTQSKLLNKSIAVLTILALIFSLIGDVALLFDTISPTYFILGLSSFLIAHVMYILVFLKHRNKAKNPFGFIVIMLIYAGVLYYYLKDGLGAMLLPVIIYMIVILSMATTAFLRRGHVNSQSFNWVFIGAIFFMISDSILALNKFYQPLVLSSISIMTTYALAQFCIVIGILKWSRNLR